ncbi:MAG: sodium:alanine symporter family protein [Clostridiales bacterium]|nr:sodium:alanine symporter family protein [Clostridiales bacterium]
MGLNNHYIYTGCKHTAFYLIKISECFFKGVLVVDNLLNFITDVNSRINSLVWGFPMLALLIGAGIYISIGTNFLQFRKFGYVLKCTMGQIFKKDGAKKGEITPFQSLTTALAGTVGTGNIAGVAGAISLGGPGAVFWMWVSATFGMATKYAEIVLALKFRQRNFEGDFVGGPMYYIKNGLGKSLYPLAILFSAFGALSAFGIGNIAQANTIASAVYTAVSAFLPSASGYESYVNLAVGIICSFFAATVLLGGLKRIGKVTEKLIPFMSILYISFSLVVILSHYDSLGKVFSMIFYGAINPRAALGGAVGIGISQAVKLGVGRGVFSNEAGLGSAPMAHASSSEKNPVKQGLYGVFEVFFDTIVVCTLTSLVILCSGAYIPYGDAAGAQLTISAFATSFGAKTAGVIIAGGIMFFAFSSILSWSLYGMRCAEFLFGSRVNKAYLIIFILIIIAGASMELSLVWGISDTLNGLMAIPNLIAVLGLSGLVFSETRQHFKKK